MIGMNKLGTIDKEKLERYIYQLMISEQYCEAYNMLQKLKDEKTMPVLFNQALCCIHASEYNQAAILLEEALSAYKINKNMMKPVKDTISMKLEALECANDTYMAPLSFECALSEPSYTVDKIVRVLIDTYSLMESWDNVRRLALTVDKKNYKNVNDIISKLR